jgi:SAM-dependent methyltransferase
MKENNYDDPDFFEKYRQMPRSVAGLEAAGEWSAFRAMLPSLAKKRVLDLGCGYGWHCRYALSQGAAEVVGIDLSARMLEEATKRSQGATSLRYVRMAIEDIDFPEDDFDVVISSLAFHYLKSLGPVYARIHHCLSRHGDLVFSAEHPIFTASERQDWHYEKHERRHWPVDNYYREGARHTRFLDEAIIKYHRTFTSYLDGLLQSGFQITGFLEPPPDADLAGSNAEMKDELRRPMFFIVSARKTAGGTKASSPKPCAEHAAS